ncbi:DUF6455 family protein [Lutimaribacter marinistellae]|uniref:DUF6455 family protein n=1 Tax=Lutimaribacter marinistellae TaxID=1820329 RepID=A0ABV7TGF6_9RHOB
MPSRDQIKHHAHLVDGMATTLGIDLQEAALNGDVSMDEVSEAVLSCTACTNPGHCAGWLEETRKAERTPEYCRNQDLFTRLIP